MKTSSDRSLAYSILAGMIHSSSGTVPALGAASRRSICQPMLARGIFNLARLWRALVFGFTLLAGPSAIWAQVSDITVTPTPSTAGASASYQIGFNAHGGIPVGLATIKIIFPAGFTFSTPTVTASSGFGTASFTVTTNSLTLKIAFDSGTSVGSGAAISVTVNGIVNPTTAGSYTVNITDVQTANLTFQYSNPADSPTFTITPALTSVAQYTWTTLAGLADNPGSEDGTGSAARFQNPSGVAVDSAGNVYVSDYSNNTIRKITAGGLVSTLAGLAGNPGSTDGTGSAARFNGPGRFGLAADSAGTVYVGDSNNDTIRKITPGGTVNTLAGLAGNPGSTDGTGSAARFQDPVSMSVDGASNVYVADYGVNHIIRKITPSGAVSTLAGLAGNPGSTDGTGSVARFNGPAGTAVDSAGNVYVSDYLNHTIRKITADGLVSTLAGLAGSIGSTDGTGSTARFNGPIGIAVDSSGNLYVADGLDYTIRKVTPGGVVSTIGGSSGLSGAGDGTGSAARFYTPSGVAVDSAGNLYVADYSNHKIRKGVLPLINGTWTPTAGGSWNTGANWNTNPDFPMSNGDSANFLSAITAPSTITPSSGLTVAQINFNNDNTYTIASGFTISLNNGASGASITSAGAGAHTINAALSIDDNTTVSNSSASTFSLLGNVVVQSTKTLTINSPAIIAIGGVISGSGSLTKSGTSSLTLSGNNIYTGTTAVNAGTLTLSGGSAIANSGAVSLANAAGAILNLAASETNGSLAGGGTTGGNVTLNANTLTTGDASSTTYAGVISGSGALTKQGTGTMTLSGANTYSGATTLNAGILKLNTGATIASSATTINSGATLTGPGTAGTIAVNSGGIISPGSSPGTLNSGNETWESGGHYVWEINNANASAGADPGWDLLNVTGTLAINATSSSKFVIDITSLTSGNVAGNVPNFDSNVSYTWHIVDTTGGITGFSADKFQLTTTPFSNGLANGIFTIAVVGNSLVLNFIQANDAPVVSGLNTTVTFAENTVNATAQLIDATGVTLTDADSTEFNTGNLTVSYSAGGTTEDQISVRNEGTTTGLIGYSAGTVTYGGLTIGTVPTSGAGSGINGTSLIVTFTTANATPAAVQALIGKLTYKNTSDTPTSSRTISVTVNDGDGGTSAAQTVQINVTAENDAPVLANIEAGTLSYTENAAATAITATLTVTDLDSSNVTGATVQITGNLASGEDVLGFATIGSINGVYTSGTGLMTLSGTDTVANYQAALRTVKYQNTSDSPSTLTRTVSFQVNDGAGANNLSNIATRDITVTAVNDAPVLADANVVLNAVNEDAGAPSGAVGTPITSLVQIGTGLNNVSDPDAGAVTGIAVTAVDTASGSWHYSVNSGSSWSALGTVSSSNARLLAADANTRIYFQPNTNFNGTINSALTFRAWDRTSGSNGDPNVNTTSNGGSTAFSTATDAAAITVNAVNDAPSFTLPSNTLGGTVVAWASNTYGETSVPSGLSGVTAIAAGYYFNLALKSDGTVVGWGSNVSGEASVPAGLSGVTTIAAGYGHSLALKSDGTVVGWGYNSHGQINMPGGLSGVTAIGAALYYSLALKSDGTVVAWGNNGNGQTSVPVGLSGVTAIGAGAVFSLALKSDGTVVAWGYNGNGETSVPAGLSGVTAIAAGANHSLALKSDGTVVAWGSSATGQTSVPGGLSGVAAIAAGSHHSLALLGSPITVPEDFGPKTVAGFMTNISPGPADESGQTVDFIVSNSNSSLFSAQPATTATGTLSYTPAANANGSSVVSVQIHDNGGTANGGMDTSAVQTFTITVTAVNDAPVLTGLNTTVTFAENTVNATAQLIDATGVTLTDADSTDFNTGNLTVSYSAGGTTQDQISIRNEGTTTGLIGYSAGTVTYGGLTIGTVPTSGAGSGINGATLAVTFTTANATPTAVQALIGNLTYQNLSDTPTSSRTISVTINDGDGGTSAAQSVQINVTTETEIPTITSFTPSSAAVGASVTITGSNFDTTSANNIVFFGAVKATVTAATATQLTVTVPSGATYGPITVRTSTGLSASSNSRFVPTFSSGGIVDASSFATKVDFAAGSGPYGTAIGDLDGDGKPDLIVANETGITLSVYRNTSSPGSIASGSFATAVTFTTASGPKAVALADVDGDGKLDVIVANSTSGSVSVFRNTSAGAGIDSSTLAARVDFTAGAGAHFVAVGDLDGDGKNDLVVANSAGSTISILRNLSTAGSITASSFATKVDITVGSQPHFVQIGDLDGDGKPDLAVSNNLSLTVSVFRNVSSPGTLDSSSFQSRVDITVGSNPISLQLADFDGDGKLDLAVENETGNIVVLRNTAAPGALNAGSFAAVVNVSSVSGSQRITVGDVNGDGKVDIVIAGYQNNTVSVRLNISTSGSITSASFATRVEFATGASPRIPSIADLDGDGRPDILVPNSGGGTISIFRNVVPFVAGVATTVQVETAVDGTGTVVPAQNVPIGSSLTVYAIRRDANGLFVNNVAADSWSLVNITGGIVSGDLVPAGNSKSAVFTGHVAGSAKIHAVSGSLTSVDSGTITVPSPTTVAWIGGTSSDWFNASNWNPAQVPGSQDTVTITGNVNLTANVTIGNLTLSGGVVTGTGNLTVTGTMTITSDTFNVPVVNRGTIVAIRDNTLNGALTMESGSVLQLLGGAGTGANSQLTVASGFSNSGVIELTSTDNTQAFLTVSSGTLINATGGRIDALPGGGGTRRIAAAVLDNRGNLNFQKSLSLDGSVTQSSSGSMLFPIGGTSGFSQFGVNGAATLTGTLNIILTNGFLPSSGNSFSVITYTSRTGTFAAINGLTQSNGQVLAPAYNSTALVLTSAGNTAPTISAIANQNALPSVAIGPLNFTIGDAETPDSLTLTASSSNPTLVPTSGIALGGTGTSRTVTVTPATGLTGTSTIQLTVSDGNLTASTSFNVAFNTAPVLTDANVVLNLQNEDVGAPSGPVGTPITSLVDFAGGGGLDNVSDADTGAVTGIAITASDTANGSWHYSLNNGTAWSPLGTVSPTSARLLAADASTRIYFQPSANFNGTISSAITFRAWDQTSGSNGGTADTSTTGGSTAFSAFADTASITINAVNDPPVLTGLNTSVTFAENTVNTTAQVIDANGVTFTDPDSADLNTGNLTVSYSVGGTAEDQISIRNEGTTTGLIGYSAGTVKYSNLTIGTVPTSGTGSGINGAALVVTFTTANATPAAVQALIGNLVYKNTSDTPAASRTVSLTISDGDGGTSAAQTVALSVTAENDAPVLAANTGLTVAEGGSGAIGANELSATDVDNTAGQVVFILVTAPAHGAVKKNGTVLTTGQTFTQTDLSTGSTIAYQHDGSEPSRSPSDQFNFTVSDGSGGSIPSTLFSITVTPVNDPPVNNLPVALSTPEDTAKVFSTANSNAITISDADAGSNPIRVTLNVFHGTLTLGGTTGITLANGTVNGTGNLEFTETISAINTALNGLSYSAPLNFNGLDTLTITSNDQGNTHWH